MTALKNSSIHHEQITSSSFTSYIICCNTLWPFAHCWHLYDKLSLSLGYSPGPRMWISALVPAPLFYLAAFDRYLSYYHLFNRVLALLIELHANGIFLPTKKIFVIVHRHSLRLSISHLITSLNVDCAPLSGAGSDLSPRINPSILLSHFFLFSFLWRDETRRDANMVTYEGVYI